MAMRQKLTSSSIHSTIIQPTSSTKQYKALKLENDLQVLLVRDEESSYSAAAMTVRCGSFLDPPKMQGLAHLLEHMVFAGSKKFPLDNELKDFLKKHNGKADASTEMEHTTFCMDVEGEFLQGALERFSHIFFEPLLKTEHIEREINLIDSEFELCKLNDYSRIDQLMAHTSSKDHPFHRFSWGNKNSLSESDLESLRQNALKLFNEHFLASSMRLVVIGNVSFKVLETWVNMFFTQLIKGSQISPKFIPRTRIWNCDILYQLESAGNNQELVISWIIPPISVRSYLKRPENYVVQLLSAEGAGSLCSLFKHRGWITSLSATVGSDTGFTSEASRSFDSTSIGRLFTIMIKINKGGLNKIYQIVSLIYNYLKLVREQSPPKWVMRDYRASLRLKFECLDIDDDLIQDPFSFAHRLAGNMLKCPVRHALSLDYLNQTYEMEAVKDLMQYFTPQNMRIDLVLKPLVAEAFQTEPRFGFKYSEIQIPQFFMNKWNHVTEIHPSLSFPPKNMFLQLRNQMEAYGGDNEDDDALQAEIDDSEDNDAMHADDDDSVQADDDDPLEADDNDEPSPPEVIVDEDLKKIFYTSERGVCSAFFCVRLKDGGDVRSRMVTKLYVELLKDELSPIIFQGDEAYLNATVSLRDDNKLELRFSGYREKLSNFISIIWETFSSFKPAIHRFRAIKETMERGLSTKPVDLLEHAQQLMLETLIEGCHDMDEKLKALKTITFDDDLCDFIPLLVSVQGICFGDLSRKEAIKISEIIQLISTQGMNFGHLLMKPKRLIRGSTFRKDVDAYESGSNSLAKVYFQMDCEEDSRHTVIAMLNLFKIMIDEEVTRQLRQQEQLGYDVGCDPDLVCGINGFYIYVVSSQYGPEFLLERIHNFVKDIKDFLEGVDKESFDLYRDSTLTSLPDDSGKSAWDLILDDSYMEGHSLKVQKQVMKVTKEDAIAFYNKYFSGVSRTCVEICIKGR